MYGTIARYRAKPGTEKQLEMYEEEIRKAKLPGMLGNFTYRMDADPAAYMEVIIFESRDAYRALADSPEQDLRYRQWVELLEAPPEWNDGEIAFAFFDGQK